MGKKYLIIAIMSMFSAQQLLAHQIWFEKIDKGYELVFGESITDTDPLPFAKVDCIAGFTKNKWKDKLPIATELYGEKEGAGHVTVSPFDTYNVLTAKMTNGYFVQVEDDTAERGYTYLKGATLNDIDTTDKNVLKTLYSTKFAKHITKWEDYLSAPIKQRLEIVPLYDVTDLKEGDYIVYTVLYEGKPIENGENTKIYRSTDPSASREDNPKVQMDDFKFQYAMVGAPGLQTITVKHKVMLNDEGTSYISIASVLTFYTK